MFFAVLGLSACSEHILTSTSPDGRNKIEIYSTQSLIIQTTFSFAAYSSDRVITKEGYLGAYDDLNKDYYRQFPVNEWISETTFRAQDFSSPGREKLDNLIIVNQTGMALDYLVVNASDRLVIFGIASKGRMEFTVPRSSGQFYLAANGKFSDGTATRGGVDFTNPYSVDGPIQYCIKIDDAGLHVGSTTIPSWTYESKDVPKWKSCD